MLNQALSIHIGKYVIHCIGWMFVCQHLITTCMHVLEAVIEAVSGGTYRVTVLRQTAQEQSSVEVLQNGGI